MTFYWRHWSHTDIFSVNILIIDVFWTSQSSPSMWHFILTNQLQYVFTYSLCLISFPPACLKAQIYSNKFFHNFHLFEPSFTFPGLRAAGLARRLYISSENVEMAIKDFTNTSWWPLTSDIWLSDLFKEVSDIFDVQLTCAKIKVNST
jgi:hypothetical protein